MPDLRVRQRVQSGGAAALVRARRGGTRPGRPGGPATPRASPRLRRDRRARRGGASTPSPEAGRPSGRGGRAERAQARPHAARRGSAAFNLRLPKTGQSEQTWDGRKKGSVLRPVPGLGLPIPYPRRRCASPWATFRRPLRGLVNIRVNPASRRPCTLALPPHPIPLPRRGEGTEPRRRGGCGPACESTDRIDREH